MTSEYPDYPLVGWKNHAWLASRKEAFVAAPAAHPQQRVRVVPERPRAGLRAARRSGAGGAGPSVRKISKMYAAVSFKISVL